MHLLKKQNMKSKSKMFLSNFMPRNKHSNPGRIQKFVAITLWGSAKHTISHKDIVRSYGRFLIYLKAMKKISFPQNDIVKPGNKRPRPPGSKEEDGGRRRGDQKRDIGGK